MTLDSYREDNKCPNCDEECLIYNQYVNSFYCEWCAHTFDTDGKMIECNYDKCCNYGKHNEKKHSFPKKDA